jgi:putative FmdB family regulatory protein
VRFDRQQKYSEPPLTKCPECSKKALRKIYLPVGIVFKGSGFYATDHRSPSGGTRANGSTKAETEDKPALKNDTSAKKETSQKE